MKKGEQSRARMVEACGDLLRRIGYHGTSFKQVIEESGAPRGSIYFHFPGGKDELVCAAIESAGDDWRGYVERAIESEPDLGRALQVACRALADRLAASQFRDGCPLATVALEAAADVEAIRDACAAQFRKNEAAIADRARAAGVPDEAARATATFVLSALEGALLLSRVYADVTPLLSVGKTLGMLGGLLAPR